MGVGKREQDQRGHDRFQRRGP